MEKFSRFLRRSSAQSAQSTSSASTPPKVTSSSPRTPNISCHSSPTSPKTKSSIASLRQALAKADPQASLPPISTNDLSNDHQLPSSTTTTTATTATTATTSSSGSGLSASTPTNFAQRKLAPILTLQQPTPPRVASPPSTFINTSTTVNNVATSPSSSQTRPLAPPTPVSRSGSPSRPSFETVFRGSGAALSQPTRTRAVDTPPTVAEESDNYFGSIPTEADRHRSVPPVTHTEPQQRQQALPSKTSMGRRKIWIKRTGASPTLIQVTEDDLVDDVREMVLRKYANSLGRSWDAPDVIVRLIPRERSHPERILSPEESISSLIDACFPGGQHVEEALIIDVPKRRTPQPSPGNFYPHPYNNHGYEETRPPEQGNDYFGAVPVGSPHPSQSSSHEHRHSVQAQPHSIGVIEGGPLPILPSPGSGRRQRPKTTRQHTSSPTIIGASGYQNNATQGVQRRDFLRMGSEPRVAGRTSAPQAPPLPETPLPDPAPNNLAARPATPPADHLAVSPPARPRKHKKRSSVAQTLHADTDDRRPSHPHPQVLSVIEATVPPINVLIVEDNPINLRLLEMFTKRLKVRWSTAMNGRDAVAKWRTGGFHLVLMDIQLPIMNGLQATKEIRRLERVNGVGVFAKGDGEPRTNGEANKESTAEGDKLAADGLFKSPVIIVALTASSLQSDRHEALAAGCNDFLTKPVHFPWLERKVMEWGCMQALIDYDGFRRWKALAVEAEEKTKKEEDQDPAKREKREKKEAKRAALMAKMGQSGREPAATAVAV